MALTSSSTLQDALNQYNDNLSWDGSATKAALALEAVRYLLVNRPQSNTAGSVRIDYSGLEEEKKKLEDYVARSSSSRTSFVTGRAILR